MYLPILERGGAEVLIDTTAMVVRLVAETDENLVAHSLWHSDGITGELGLSVLFWGTLFDLTGNYF